MTSISLGDNKMIKSDEIVFSQFRNLKDLALYRQNDLTSLDLSLNTKLESFYFVKNDYVMELDLSKQTKLRSIYCSHSYLLESLKLAGSYPALEYVDCSNSNLGVNVLNALIDVLPDALPSKSQSDDKFYFVKKGNPGTSGCNKQAAINKGWTVE